MARLEGAAWRVLGRQVRVGHCELDIVAVEPGPRATLVVVEVRWRRDRAFGLPEDTFDARKRRNVRRAVLRLLDGGCLPDGTSLPHLPLRVDLIVVEPSAVAGGPPRIRHHRDALSG